MSDEQHLLSPATRIIAMVAMGVGLCAMYAFTPDPGDQVSLWRLVLLLLPGGALVLAGFGTMLGQNLLVALYGAIGTLASGYWTYFGLVALQRPQYDTSVVHRFGLMLMVLFLNCAVLVGSIARWRRKSGDGCRQ